MNKSYKLSDVINKALFDKDQGYYRSKNPLGKTGDFITSPEISQIFGEIILNYLLYIFSIKKPQLSLVEIGAGRGFLFFDILLSLINFSKKNQPIALEFIKKTTFHIVEINPVLIKFQQIKLQKFSEIFNIKWHSKFSEFLDEKNGEIYLITNELFDCFAIDQFVKTNQGWCQRVVQFEDYNNFINPKIIIDEFTEEIDQFVKKELNEIIEKNSAIGAIFEYSFDARNFMSEICKSIKTNGGMAINCDYGYYHYDFANTLQALKNHQKVNFIDSLVDCDISAHVDFFALDKIAKNFNLNTSLVSQRQFLLELGALKRSQLLIAKNPAQAQEISQGLERLISPMQMGELFKFHIIWQ